MTPNPLKAYPLRLVLIIGFSATMGWGNPSVAQTANPVIVELANETSYVGREIIRIGDIANITGGSPQLRDRLAQIDIDSISQDGSQVTTVSAKQIRYRLLLDGWSDKAFVLIGNGSTRVFFRSADSIHEPIKTAVMRSLASSFNQSAENFELQLDTASLENINQQDLEVLLPQIDIKWGSQIPVGTRSFSIDYFDRTGLKKTLNFKCTIALMRDFVIANSNIPRGQIIRADQVTKVRRPISDRNAKLVSFQQVVGMMSTTDIQQFETIRSQSVKPTANSFDPGKVTRNSLVNAVIQKGSLNITIKNMRAMQSGAAGQRIEVINPLNNRRMAAVVIDAQTVQLY